MSRGFFAVGVVHSKSSENIGTLLRSAHAFGASLLFTVGRRYKQQRTDTTKAWRHVPLLHVATVAELVEHLPYSTELVGIEIDPRAKPLSLFIHPERACYLLGAEDHGLNEYDRARCKRIIQVEGADRCLNVAVAGSLVMWHRVAQFGRATLEAVS